MGLARLLGNDVSVVFRHLYHSLPCPDLSKDKQQPEMLKQVRPIQTHLGTDSGSFACLLLIGQTPS